MICAFITPLPCEASELLLPFFGQLPYEKNAIIRAHKMKVEDIYVKVCSPEDLILHKVLSEREKDRKDVEGIILSQCQKLDRVYLDPLVKQVSEELAQPEILKFYNNCFAKVEK